MNEYKNNIKKYIDEDRDFLKFINRNLRKYGYEPFDLDLSKKGRKVVNKAVQKRLLDMNTFARGQYTLKNDSIKYLQDILTGELRGRYDLSKYEKSIRVREILRRKGVYIKDFKNAIKLNKKLKKLGIEPTEENRLRYGMNHIPSDTGHGRQGSYLFGDKDTGLLYTSNSVGHKTSVANRYSVPSAKGRNNYIGAVGILRRPFRFSSNRYNWINDAEFYLSTGSGNELKRYYNYLMRSNKSISKDLQNEFFKNIYNNINTHNMINNLLNKDIKLRNRVDNAQKYLKEKGIFRKIDYLEQLNDIERFINNKSYNKSYIYSILNNKLNNQTKIKYYNPQFKKFSPYYLLNNSSNITKYDIYDTTLKNILGDNYINNINPVFTTEGLFKQQKGYNNTQHYIFSGKPGEKVLDLIDFRYTNYNDYGPYVDHGHKSRYNPLSRKTFKNGGKKQIKFDITL